MDNFIMLGVQPALFDLIISQYTEEFIFIPLETVEKKLKDDGYFLRTEDVYASMIRIGFIFKLVKKERCFGFVRESFYREAPYDFEEISVQ